jgi:hypothetical protein
MPLTFNLWDDTPAKVQAIAPEYDYTQQDLALQQNIAKQQGERLSDQLDLLNSPREPETLQTAAYGEARKPSVLPTEITQVQGDQTEPPKQPVAPPVAPTFSVDANGVWTNNQTGKPANSWEVPDKQIQDWYRQTARQDTEKNFTDPLLKLVEQTAPKIDTQTPERLKRAAAMNSIGQALSVIGQAYFGSKGAPIFKDDNQFTPKALAEFQRMNDKDQEAMYKHNLNKLNIAIDGMKQSEASVSEAMRLRAGEEQQAKAQAFGADQAQKEFKFKDDQRVLEQTFTGDQGDKNRAAQKELNDADNKERAYEAGLDLEAKRAAIKAQKDLYDAGKGNKKYIAPKEGLTWQTKKGTNKLLPGNEDIIEAVLAEASDTPEFAGKTLIDPMIKNMKPDEAIDDRTARHILSKYSTYTDKDGNEINLVAKAQNGRHYLQSGAKEFITNTKLALKGQTDAKRREVLEWVLTNYPNPKTGSFYEPGDPVIKERVQEILNAWEEDKLKAKGPVKVVSQEIKNKASQVKDRTGIM